MLSCWLEHQAWRTLNISHSRLDTVSRSTANQAWPPLTVPPTSRATLGTPFSKGTEPPLRQATALRVNPQARVDRVCEIGPVVGAHGGPGALGLLVLRE